MLTRFEDVRLVSKNPGLFSSAKGAGPMLAFEGTGYDMSAEMLAIYRANMVAMDPPEHRDFRSVVAPYLSGPAVKQLESDIRDLVVSLLDGIEIGKPFDLVREYSAITPAVALCRLLGVPPQDHPRMIEWGDALAGHGRSGISGVRVGDPDRGVRVRLATSRAEEGGPGADLLTAAVQAYSAQDTKLPFGAMEGLFTIMTIAGHRTTRNTITSGLLALYDHPDQLELLRSEPGSDRQRGRGDPPILDRRSDVSTDRY